MALSPTNAASATAPAASPVRRLQGARALLDGGLAWARRRPIIPLAVGGALVVATLMALLLWAGGPDYRVLYSNLSDNDGGRIIAALEQQGVPYKFAQGGHALLVPADKVYKLRLNLAEQGLPEAGNVGFKIMDKQPFGISQFAEQVNYQRGLQGELANSIEALRPVASARVNLAMPKDSLFVREREPAKATVVLTLRPGRALGDGQVNAIVHMVASSVRDLAPDNVTVVDQDGRLLTRNGSNADLDGTQLDYQHEIEQRYRQRIVDILKPLVGADNVHAQVTAQLDFAKREETDERYAPNQGDNPAAVRSQQVSYSTSSGDDAAGGIPGALTNTPPGAAASPINNRAAAAPPSSAPAIGAAPNPANANPATGANAAPIAGAAGAKPTDTARGDVERQSTTNYEVDHRINHIQHHQGAVQRLSVAVVVNYVDQKQKDGSTRQVPLPAAELKQINDLTREAMGFSAQRGDTLAVVNSAFSTADAAADQESFWHRFDWGQLASTLARYLAVLVALALLYRLVVKPLREHYKKYAATALAPRVAVAAAAAGLAEDEIEAAPARKPRRKSATYESSLNDLKDMAKNDPGMVAMIVRNWVKRDDA
ncbi:MAG TPA: flagellar basal-body MS-ring/collar protein FliF [Rhodanobacteraceae bacterium]|nr:flagellar basal-body MS-ring/collar protein FliF [Rhodanobacteraceae bacterium]